ncbi:MAG: isoprenoid biosynthesis glyoxalase ElbB [Planctomycetota bacterium]
MAKVGVVLSGCGFKDGAEIHESVATLLALAKRGAEVVCMAPNTEFDVVDHLTGEPTGETRNVLQESARIARGDIRDIAEVQADELDALIFPGGFGAAKNLCSFATAGADAQVNPDVVRLVRDVHNAGKPIGAICIAPAMLAAAFRGETKATLTIGNDAGTAEALQAMGAEHKECPVTEFVVDTEQKVVSTPAYMLANTVAEVVEGVDKTVDAVLGMVGN